MGQATGDVGHSVLGIECDGLLVQVRQGPLVLAQLAVGLTPVAVGRSVQGVEFVCPVTTSFPLLLPCKKPPGPLGRDVCDSKLSPPHANTRVPHRGNLVNDQILPRAR